MRNIILAVAASVVAAPAAHAISRYESQSITCSQVRSAVASEGAVILRYRSPRNPGPVLYDRYVAHGGYCARGTYAEVVGIPAADTPSCPVYVCKEWSHPDSGGD